jgi:hypothetical protein
MQQIACKVRAAGVPDAALEHLVVQIGEPSVGIAENNMDHGEATLP